MIKNELLNETILSRLNNPSNFSLRENAFYHDQVSQQLSQIQTPAYVIDDLILKRNAELMANIQSRTGCKIILALKAFSSFCSFEVLKPYLAGVSASSLNETRLGHEAFGKEVHVYSPAYKEDEFNEIKSMANHLTFNSNSQLKKFSPQLQGSDVSIGLRVNPEYSEVGTLLYDPCQKYSRFGVTLAEFDPSLVPHLQGLHFHSLCSLKTDTLKRTLDVIEEKFSDVLPKMDWVNFGGGHHITSEEYDVDGLCELIINFQTKYNLQVILEPGEAIVYQAGYFVTQVVDLMKNEMEIAVLDSSATAHMPDILEMPYRPHIQSAGQTDEFDHTYRLTGATCLSGDIIGDFSFKTPLKIGQRLIFFDMAQYTLVKNTHFNGLNLPDIAKLTVDGSFEMVKTFGYESFKDRLS